MDSLAVEVPAYVGKAKKPESNVKRTSTDRIRGDFDFNLVIFRRKEFVVTI